MNQVETLCDALLEIGELLLPVKDYENFYSRICLYRRGGRCFAASIHGDVGRLLGIARFWRAHLMRFDIYDAQEAALQKAVQVLRKLKSGMIATLELAVSWFQAERRRCMQRS